MDFTRRGIATKSTERPHVWAWVETPEPARRKRIHKSILVHRIFDAQGVGLYDLARQPGACKTDFYRLARLIGAIEWADLVALDEWGPS